MTMLVTALAGRACALPLANLLTPENTGLEALDRAFRANGPGSPQVLVVLLAAAVMTGTVYYVWRWQQRRLREPSSGALLALLGGELGLSKPQQRLLRDLGRAAGLEPAAALISPQLFSGMVDRAEQGGMHLSGARTLQAGQILDAISAGCQSMKND